MTARKMLDSFLPCGEVVPGKMDETMNQLIKSRPVRFAILVASFMGTWMLLSGLISARYLMIGAIGSVMIALGIFSWTSQKPFPILRFLSFLPWHLTQVVISNLRVAKVAMSRQAAIEPEFIWVKPGMEDERALTTLGCGLTLTPGTLTVDVDSEIMLVHALDKTSAEDIRRGDMATRVAKIFE
jgi:multicomponent Na+:H+ antiporter subunit E